MFLQNCLSEITNVHILFLLLFGKKPRDSVRIPLPTEIISIHFSSRSRSMIVLLLIFSLERGRA